MKNVEWIVNSSLPSKIFCKVYRYMYGPIIVVLLPTVFHVYETPTGAIAGPRKTSLSGEYVNVYDRHE